MPFLSLPLSFQPPTKIEKFRNGQLGLTIEDHQSLVRFRPHYLNCRSADRPDVENEEVMRSSLVAYPKRREHLNLLGATAVQSGRAIPKKYWHLLDLGDDQFSPIERDRPRQRLIHIIFQGRLFTKALNGDGAPDERHVALYEAIMRHELVQLSIDVSPPGPEKGKGQEEATPLFLQL